MKKTLIASAIAAATFSGSVLAQESNLPTVYGNIQYAGVYSDIKDGPNGLEHRDNGSTLGFTHDHMITPDLEGFFKIEMDRLGADDIDSRDSFRIDEAYIGVRGDNLGQLWIGSDDSTYERAVTVISEYYEAADLSIGAPYTTGEGDLVQYMSPSFGGLSLWAAVEVNGKSDSQNTTGDNEFPYQLAAVYTTGMFELAAAIDSNDNSVGDNENTYGVRGTANLDALSLTAEFHTRDEAYDLYGVQGIYTLGANRFALSYERAEDDNSSDAMDTITLQALHNLSDNMYVYVEGYLGGGDDVYGYNAIDTDGDGENDAFADYSDEASVAAVGAVYYF
ncbi:porin [Marinobacter lacisalsi]|uniref:Porin n=1 Tax=Marinobacter lacisalsi TaxID=475979 RepID=A0ABV8QFI3_9GAMM